VVTLPPDPIQQQTTYGGALSAFRALPEVRILFDNGVGTSPTGNQTPGDPYPGFEHSFSTLPVPGTTARFWYFGRGGRLGDRAAVREQINWYRANPKALPLNDYADPKSEGGGLWGNASQWQWTWKPNPAGTAVSYVSAPLAGNTTVVGAGGPRCVSADRTSADRTSAAAGSPVCGSPPSGSRSLTAGALEHRRRRRRAASRCWRSVPRCRRPARRGGR